MNISAKKQVLYVFWYVFMKKNNKNWSFFVYGIFIPIFSWPYGFIRIFQAKFIGIYGFRAKKDWSA